MEAAHGGAAAAEEEIIRHRTVEANGIAMHVAEAGPEDGRAVLFLHGFPELWYSWRHQMAHLAARGYRCVAPDLRGYGGTEAPPDVASYTAFHVVGDAVALLDALGLHKVFLVGHDWGAIIAWYMCLFRPDRVTALLNTSVAFMRPVFIRTGAGAVKTTDHFNRAYGPTYYVCRFQEPGVAEKEFAPAHARQLMTRILSDRRLSERAAGKVTEESVVEAAEPTLPAWLTEADIDYFTAAFEKTGFTGAINYYRNMDRNWELAGVWADAKVTVPTKFIVGQNLRDDQFADADVTMRLVEVTNTEGLPLVYSPEIISAYWGKRPGAVATRAVQLLSVAGGFISHIISDLITDKIKENEVSRAIELREIVTSLGPAYIKFGQALSIRPDILSPAAMTELQKLCDKVPSFPDDIAMALLEEELGRPWQEIYSELSPSPIVVGIQRPFERNRRTGSCESAKTICSCTCHHRSIHH